MINPVIPGRSRFAEPRPARGLRRHKGRRAAGPERRGSLTLPRPPAPYEPDTAKAPLQAFDRNNGKPVSPDRLMTCAEALAQYHLSPESKFANGGARDRGLTERRHVVATGMRLIGKEGTRIEEERVGTGDGVVEFRYMSQDE